MQSYSHWLLTAALSKKMAVPGRAMVVGSILPDVPLGLLTLAYLLDRRWLRPHLPDKSRCSPTYNNLYFHNRWWVAACNLFHAPLPLLVLGVVGYWSRPGRGLFWLAVGCGLHSAIDIVTHAGDGPVVAFPLNWDYRITAPVSYWDEEHGGRLFRIGEHLFDLILLIYLGGRWQL